MSASSSKSSSSSSQPRLPEEPLQGPDFSSIVRVRRKVDRRRSSPHSDLRRSSSSSSSSLTSSSPPKKKKKHRPPLQQPDNTFTIAGFGSLLSVRSATATFPDLSNFRVGRIRGFRRVFAHTTSVFHVRGVARGREAASLSIEECDDDGDGDDDSDNNNNPRSSSSNSLVVTLFEVPYSEEAAAALLEREHEFRFVAVRPLCRAGVEEEAGWAVACAAWSDDGEYRRLRIRDEEDWRRRYSGVSALGKPFSISSVWDEGAEWMGGEEEEEEEEERRGKEAGGADGTRMILPCRAYLRHVVLAARALGDDAERCVLDNTFLADRRTTVREHLRIDPTVMLELPPEGLETRYGG